MRKQYIILTMVLILLSSSVFAALGHSQGFIVVSTGGTGNIMGLTQNGTYFYVTDYNDNDLDKKLINGTAVSTIDVTGLLGASSASVYIDGSFYVTGFSNDEVYVINAINESYNGTHWDIAQHGNTYPHDMTFYDDHIWIIDDTKKVFKYDLGGNYVLNFTTLGLFGIGYGDGFFWISDETSQEIYQYNATNLTYTGVHFDTAGALNQNPRGVTVFNYSIWVADNTDLYIYRYEGINETAPPPPPGAPDTPIIKPPTPEDNANNNSQVILNVSHPTANNDVRYYLYFDDETPLTEADLIYDNVTRNASEYSTWTTNVAVDGIYYYKWRVQNISGTGLFSLNTSERSWTYDTTSPTITIGGNNNFSATNTTIISNYISNLTVNISFFDTNLYRTLINITNESGTSIYQRLNTSITGTTVNISEIVDINNLSIGNYTIKLSVTDDHTKDKIKDYKINTGLSYYRYTTSEGNIIKIKSDTLPLTKRTSKLKDRYDFEFGYLFQKDTYTFIIESYNPISYIEDSDYKAHFVIMGSSERGNWIDFDNPNLDKEDYTITKIDDYSYEVEIEANGKKNFKFSSLGGLNTLEKHYLLRIGAVIDVWVYDEENYPNKINATVTIGAQNISFIAYNQSNVTKATLMNITKETTSLNLTSSGFGTEENTISITSNYHNLSFNMTTVSATKLYFYDENSEALITGETFSVYLETTGFSQTYSAATNPYSITSLADGLYKLKASSTNYPEREYRDLNISNITTTNLNIYLINLTIGSEITFNVLDSDSNDIEDVDVVFTRVINGTSTVIAEEQTDFGGKCKLYLDTNYEYPINFSKTNYKPKTINLEPSSSDSPYTIYLDDAVGLIPPIVEAYQIRKIFRDGITYNLTFTNSTKVVHFDWYDKNNYSDNVCLNVNQFNKSWYSNCSTRHTGSMDYVIELDNQTYNARAYAIKNSNQYTLKIISINLLKVLAKLGKDMLIISWMVFIVLGFMGLAKPFAAMILGILGLSGMYLIGMLPIGFSTIMGIIFVAIVIGVGIKKSRQG